MKRFISIILIVIMIFSCTACGKKVNYAGMYDSSVGGTYMGLVLTKEGDFGVAFKMEELAGDEEEAKFVADILGIEPDGFLALRAGTYKVGDEQLYFTLNEEQFDPDEFSNLFGTTTFTATYDKAAEALNTESNDINGNTIKYTLMKGSNDYPKLLTEEDLQAAIEKATQAAIEQLNSSLSEPDPSPEPIKETGFARLKEQSDGSFRYESDEPKKMTAQDAINYLGRPIDEVIDAFGSCTARPSYDAPAYVFEFDCLPGNSFGYCADNGNQAGFPYEPSDIMYCMWVEKEGDKLFDFVIGDSTENVVNLLGDQIDAEDFKDYHYASVNLGHKMFLDLMLNSDGSKLEAMSVNYYVW